MKNNQDLVSAYQIAQQLNRSHKSVVANIIQLSIQPALTVSNKKYYHPSTIEKVDQAMRAPNKKAHSHTPLN